MMGFGTTAAHKGILEAVKETLASYGISAIRADERHYHDELFQDIVTLMYGCKFGIAIFERIEQQTFNANVAFEVGYMKALGKEVCLLKDERLSTLQTDLIGMRYYTFDPNNAITSIRPGLGNWLRNRKLILTSIATSDEAHKPDHDTSREDEKSKSSQS
jgi:hypothetical protein